MELGKQVLLMRTLVSGTNLAISGVGQNFLKLLFRQAARGGFVGQRVAKFEEVAGGFAAEAVVVAGGEDDGDFLLVALDDDWFGLRGVEEAAVVMTLLEGAAA